MRKVIVSTYVTLDGRVDEVRDWAVPYDDDGAVDYHTDLLMNSDGLLLGHKTYELFAALWPSRAGEFPYVDKLDGMAKHVASTTLKDLEWENSQLIEGDVAEDVAMLKQQPGQDLVMYGCHDLMHSLLEHDLIDEYRILVQPVLLGKGEELPQGRRGAGEPRSRRHHRDPIRGGHSHLPAWQVGSSAHEPLEDSERQPDERHLEMHDRPVFLYAAVYDEIAEAEADYQAVFDLHAAGAIGTFDSAVIRKEADGKVRVTKTENQPSTAPGPGPQSERWSGSCSHPRSSAAQSSGPARAA